MLFRNYYSQTSYGCGFTLHISTRVENNDTFGQEKSNTTVPIPAVPGFI